jgi:hypothetical protein
VSDELLDPAPDEAPDLRHPNVVAMAEFDEDLITYDDFDEAIIGVGERACHDSFVIYDRKKCIEILEAQMRAATPDDQRGENDPTAWEEAEEYFAFNVIGGWVGERTPVVLTTIADIKEGML